MTLIHDIRNRTQRTNGIRSLSQIKYIARHHSASTSGDFFSFWKYWNGTKGWNTGGYHEIILRDGSVQLCYDPHEITNGVKGHNTGTYHICVVGSGSFTAAQEKTFKERCLYNMSRLNVPIARVLGHNEFKGASTACPGIDMNTVRKSLQSDVIPASVNRGYLMEGDTGPKVEELQKNLNQVGFSLTVDGSFGPATKEAVLKFQLRTSLERDGIFGDSTKAKLAETISRTNEITEVETLPTKEDDKLELSKRQREEIAETFKKARERGVFSSAEHEKAIVEDTMTQSELLYLNNLIAGAALIGGERIGK